MFQSLGIEPVERVVPQRRREDTGHADLRSVERARASRRRGLHVDEVAEEVLGAGQRRGPTRHTHRDPGQRHPAGQLLEQLRIVVDRPHPGGCPEQVVGAVAEQGDDVGVEGVVHARGMRQVPVGRCREHRAQLAEPRQVHRVWGRGEDIDVGDDDVRPAGGDGPLDPVPQQDGHVVGERVDRRGRLDDDERDVAGPHRGVLREVGDRPRADRHDAAGTRHVRVELGACGFVRVELPTRFAQDGDPGRESLRERGHDARLEVLATSTHRRAVHDQQDISGAAHLRDVVGKPIERAPTEADPADADRPVSVAVEAPTQVIEVRGIGQHDAIRHAGDLEKPGSTASNRSRYRPYASSYAPVVLRSGT